MIARIACKEWLEMFRDGRFRLLSAVLLVVSVVSLLAGWRQYADLSRQHRVAQQSTREQWLAQPAKNPHAAAHYGVYAFKPVSQLAIVDTGLDPYMGLAVWLEAHKQNEAKYRPAADRTAVQRFGEMTAAAVLQLFVPLFIVLMTFACFAGEREAGTLRQVLSLGVSRRTLAVGKALGVARALFAILLPSTLIAIVALALTTSDGLLASEPARVIGLGAVYLSYFAIMIAIGLAVSARVASSRVALLLLLSFWFGNGLVASRAVSDIAARLHPTPSAVAFQRSLEADLNDAPEMARRLDARRAELFTRYGVSSIEALPIAFSGVSLQEGEDHGNEVFDRHYGQLFSQYERQDRVFQIGGLLAPTLAVRSLSMALAGTDIRQQRHFLTAAEDYRRRIQREMNAEIMAKQKRGQVYVASRELWSRVPPFAYVVPSLGWVLAGQRWSLTVLAVWLLGGGLALWVATRSGYSD